jgi:uncharacterized protein YjbI with pentapeptide repeats
MHIEREERLVTNARSGQLLTIQHTFDDTFFTRTFPNKSTEIVIMEQNYITDQQFEKVDFKEQPLKKGEYEQCTFKDCDFTKNDFSNITFTDCLFQQCNISLVKLTMTSFQDIIFRSCKMMGLHFEECNEFVMSFQFDGCNLEHSSFYKTTTRGTTFKNTTLRDTDFTECDLTGSSFDNCDLQKAMFDHTNLEKVDFRTALNYSIDPEKNRLKKTRVSSSGLAGLLNKYDLLID